MGVVTRFRVPGRAPEWAEADPEAFTAIVLAVPCGARPGEPCWPGSDALSGQHGGRELLARQELGDWS